MDTRLQHGITIGAFEVRPLEGRVIGPDGPQHVQPKAMEVLLCLAEHPGDVVERETLIERAWGGAAGSDDLLTRCISELRQHFDDHHDAVRYIQTLPKRGYRLVAAVDAPAEEQEPPTALARFWADLHRRHVIRVSIAYIVVSWIILQVGDTIFEALLLPNWALTLLLVILALGFPVAIIMAWIFQVTAKGVVVDVAGSSQEPVNLRRYFDIIIIGALVVAVSMLGYRELAGRTGGEVPATVSLTSPVSSIAVLRFLNIGGESHFADGLGEELLDRLAHFKELGVAARTSSWALSDTGVDVPTIAKRLAVKYVLEGSVRQSGDRIRITAQLNDGATGKHVWSQTYDRELTPDNFFETQTEIARNVVTLLEISLSPESESSLTAKPQTNMLALDYYLQAQEQYRRPHSLETLDAAEELFQRSLQVDPRFAMAFAGLCNTELSRYVITRDVSTFEAAERACHRALTLDKDTPRVMAALGALYFFSGQYEKADEELTRAIGVNPNLIDSYADLGESLEYLGRTDEAEAWLQQMIVRQPGYWYGHNALGGFLYRQARYEEAAESYKRVVELQPDRALGYNNSAIASYMIGDFAAASQAYERSIGIEPYFDNLTNLGLSYFYEGRYDDAVELQHKAIAMRPDDARAIGRLATAYYFSGREQEAIPVFENAIQLLDQQLAINPSDVRLNRFSAVYNVTVGNIELAQAAISHALQLQPESAGVHYDAAKVALAAGQSDIALKYLQQARNLGYSIHIINSDPVFRSLHSNTRFLELAHE